MSAQWETPPVLATGSPEEIEAAAIAEARADIEAKRPRVAFTGGFVPYPFGIPDQFLDLVKGLPNVPLPYGCTEPLVSQAMIYATAYNKEILPYLLKSKAGPDSYRTLTTGTNTPSLTP